MLSRVLRLAASSKFRARPVPSLRHPCRAHSTSNAETLRTLRAKLAAVESAAPVDAKHLTQGLLPSSEQLSTAVTVLASVWTQLNHERNAFAAAVAREAQRVVTEHAGDRTSPDSAAAAASADAELSAWHARLHLAFLAFFDATWRIMTALHPSLLSNGGGTFTAQGGAKPQPQPQTHAALSTRLVALMSAVLDASLSSACFPDAAGRTRLLSAAALRSVRAATSVFTSLTTLGMGGGGAEGESLSLLLRTAARAGAVDDALPVLFSLRSRGARLSDADALALLDAADAAEGSGEGGGAARFVTEHLLGLVREETEEAVSSMSTEMTSAVSSAAGSGDAGGAGVAADAITDGSADEGDEGDSDDSDDSASESDRSGSIHPAVSAHSKKADRASSFLLSGDEADDEYSTGSDYGSDGDGSASGSASDESSGGESSDEGADGGVGGDDAASAARLDADARWWRSAATSVIAAAPARGIEPEVFTSIMTSLRSARDAGLPPPAVEELTALAAAAETLAAPMSSRAAWCITEEAFARAASRAAATRAAGVLDAARAVLGATQTANFPLGPLNTRTNAFAWAACNDTRVHAARSLAAQIPGVRRALLDAVAARATSAARTALPEVDVQSPAFARLRAAVEAGTQEPAPAVVQTAESEGEPPVWPSALAPVARTQLVHALAFAATTIYNARAAV